MRHLVDQHEVGVDPSAAVLQLLGHLTDASGRILSGQTVPAFWHSVRHARPPAVGLNRALGTAVMRPYIEELAMVAGGTHIG